MAKKTSYKVVFRGQTFTRTTARTYTHLVVGRWCLARSIADAHHPGRRAMDLKNHAFDCRETAALAAGTTVASSWHTPEHVANMAAAAAMTAEAYADSSLAASLAAIERHRLAGDYGVFRDLGWCGRVDLAQKLAASKRADGYHLDVTILTVPSAPGQ